MSKDDGEGESEEGEQEQVACLKAGGKVHGGDR
jgi:hypothetical protein